MNITYANRKLPVIVVSLLFFSLLSLLVVVKLVYWSPPLGFAFPHFHIFHLRNIS